MHFPTRLSGAVDSVMFSHSDVISRWAGIVFESWYRFFLYKFLFSYVSCISNIFPTANTSPSQARQIAASV